MRDAKLLVSSAVMVCIFSMASIVDAKSVFAVASHSNSTVKAYLIDGDKIDYQATIKDTESFGDGATGLCVWPSVERLFVTYEGSPTISWASTKTLKRDNDDEIEAPESNLAGIVADETFGVLYVVTRWGGHLYTYTFDEEEDTLVLVHPNDPAHPNRKYRQLEGLENGSTYGLALDEEGGEPVLGIATGLLYVANGTTTVRYYNTMTWDCKGSVDMEEAVCGLDVDGDEYLERR